MIRLRLSRVAIVAILIITAIPAGLRDPAIMYWRPILRFRDAFENILLYFPLGLFLQSSSTLASVIKFGAGMSTIIEVTQLFFIRRNAQPADIVANTMGALLGALAGRFFRIQSDRVKLGTVLGLVAIATAFIWLVAYLSVWWIVPPFVGRGTIAAVAFLCAMGFTGIVKPRNSHSRIAIAAMGGILGAAALLPAGSMPIFFTFALGILFGIALVYCTQDFETGGDS